MSQKIQVIVEGGKATATPQLAQTLGPMKINLSEVLSKINQKTAAFHGIKVPVEVIVEKDKSYDVTVGSPPTAELIKKEAALEKGSGTPDKVKVANVAIEQVIKIAKMKWDSSLARNLKNLVKTVVGSCSSLGVLVEGKTGAEMNADIEAGKYDKEIVEEKTDVNPERLKILKEQMNEINEKLKKEMEKLKALEEEKPAATVVAPTEAATTEAGKEPKPGGAAPSGKPGAAEKTPAGKAAAPEAAKVPAGKAKPGK